MARVLLFPGSDRERAALLAAVNHYCACDREAAVVHGPCAAHALLLDEARLKHLIFYRRWQPALRRGEWLEDPRWRQRSIPGERLAG